MNWYNEERDGETKRLIEWAFGVEMEPEEEPGFYRPKNPTIRLEKGDSSPLASSKD